MTSRFLFEWYSTQGRKVIDRTDKWILTEVFGSFEMYVMNGDSSITPHLVGEGFWESWISSWMTQHIDENTTFWDIGANTGYYSWLALEQGAQMVVAWEPNPAYYQMIKATREHNKIKSNFAVADYALSDENGEATLWIPQHLHGSASMTEIDDRYKPTPVQIKTKRLETVLNDWMPGNNIVKIDAEGAEEKIWRGMGSLLERENVPTFVLEYTPTAYSDNFIDELQAFGTIKTIDHNGDEQVVGREWIEAQNDWVMLVLRRD